MPNKLEVEGLLGFADEIILLLNPIELALKHVDRVECSVGTHATLYWARLLPFLYNIVDLVLHDLVLRDDLQLRTGYKRILDKRACHRHVATHRAAPGCSWIESFLRLRISL